jgi:hypothetical protein
MGDQRALPDLQSAGIQANSTVTNETIQFNGNELE